jgi:hypothetical protein
VLAPRTAFDADHTSTDVTLDLPYVESLFQQVARVTGVLGGTYTVAVEPRVHVIGTVAGDAVQTSYAPSLRFQLNATQLLPSGGSSTSGGSSSGFSQQQSASVGTPATAANAFKIGGVSVEIPLLRWISLIGLLLSAVASAFFYLRKRGEPFEETFRIQAQYGHLIVPIVGGEDLGWPPVDVPSIKALVRLAESGQRLILHSRSNDIDTYLVNDEGTVYRYQVKPSKVIWGEWSETAEPVKLAA